MGVIQKIQKGLQNNPIILPDGRTTLLGISGGIALYPLHADAASGLIRSTDEALYRAKKSNRGKILVAKTGDS